MLLLNFSHSPKQERANSSTQTLKYNRFWANALTAHALRTLVRDILSLYMPANVTHANGFPLNVNHNLLVKLAQLLETAIKKSTNNSSLD